MKQIPLIIDTDPGIDDAVAIALAVFNPRFDVRLITTVAGNVSIEATTTNALKLMAYYGKDVPLAPSVEEGYSFSRAVTFLLPADPSA